MSYFTQIYEWSIGMFDLDNETHQLQPKVTNVSDGPHCPEIVDRWYDIEAGANLYDKKARSGFMVLGSVIIESVPPRTRKTTQINRRGFLGV